MTSNSILSRLLDGGRSIDLRFVDVHDESRFKETLRKHLHWTGIVTCIALILMASSKNPFYDSSYSFLADDPRWLRFWIQFTALTLSPLLLLFMFLLSICANCLQKFNFEFFLTLLITIVCVVLPLQADRVAAELYGTDSEIELGKDTRYSEGNVALMLDVIVTGMCLFIPIRTNFKWLPAVLGSASFVFSTFFTSSPFPQVAISNVLYLCILSAFSFLGAWRSEKEARQKFSADCITQREVIQVDVQREAIAEKSAALEILLSMLCDATVWLNEESIILKCDERFDMMNGKAMKGHMLSDCFTPEELTRVRTVLDTASDIPAFFSTIVRTFCGESEIHVDCVAVRRATESKTTSGSPSKVEEWPTFLIGMRIAKTESGSRSPNKYISEGTPSPGCPSPNKYLSEGTQSPRCQAQVDGLETERMVATASDGSNLNLERIPERMEKTSLRSEIAGASDGLSTVLASFETTSTGRIFKNIKETRETYTEMTKLGRREGWLFESKDVELLPKEILGAGSFGIVVGAILHGTRVAVKVPKRKDDRLDAEHLSAVANEIRILRHVRHPNIVLFFGAYVESATAEICLILEHITGTLLSAFIRDLQHDAKVHTRWRLILDITCALRYLHASQPQVVHGDLKPSNIQVENGSRAKLLDFGLARVLTKGAQPMAGSLRWMAPEVILVRKARPSSSSDVFSFGRVVYMILSRKQPLENFERISIIEMAKAGQTMPLLWPDEMPLKKDCFDLCERTSSSDQARRPTMDEVHEEVSRWTHAEFEDCVPFASHGSRSYQTSELRNEASICEVRSAVQSSEPRSPPPRKDESISIPGLGLVLPKKMPTQQRVKKLMLTMQAMHWNFDFPRESCCSWHAACNDMASVIQALRQRPCIATFLPHSKWQCKGCGYLDVQEPCIMCGSSPNSSSNLLSERIPKRSASISL